MFISKGENVKMVETIKLKKNILRKKLEENLKTRMAVYIYIYISYIVI